MPWVRIDDHFDEHPKLAAVGPLAWGVWLAGIAYCNRNLTDGFIPRSKAHSFTTFETVDEENLVWTLGRSSGHSGFDIDSEWVIGLLLGQGLWEIVPGGYRVHDYEDFQPTKAQVLADREQKRAAGKAGGEAAARARAKRSAIASGTAGAKAEGVAESKPVPKPKPKPDTETPTSKKPSPQQSRGSSEREFEKFWQDYPHRNGKIGKQPARVAWRKLSVEDRREAIEGLSLYGQVTNGFAKDPERYLKHKLWDGLEAAPVEDDLPNAKDL